MGVDIRVRVKGGGHVSQLYGEPAAAAVTLLSLCSFYRKLMFFLLFFSSK